jgi:hypothetical protein
LVILLRHASFDCGFPCSFRRCRPAASPSRSHPPTSTRHPCTCLTIVLRSLSDALAHAAGSTPSRQGGASRCIGWPPSDGAWSGLIIHLFLRILFGLQSYLQQPHEGSGVAEDYVLNKKDSSRELAFELIDEAIHLLDASDDNLAAAHLEMAIATLPPLASGDERVRRPRNNVSQ